VKFAICGIGQDLADLVSDHASVERLLEEGAIHVLPMGQSETEEIFHKAEKLFNSKLYFEREVISQIASVVQGYPYFAQLIGKECVAHANTDSKEIIDEDVFQSVLEDIKEGRAFPTLETAYQRAIGRSADREILLHLLAEQAEENAFFNDEVGSVFLKQTRKDAEGFDVKFVDQLIPRLVDPAYGPVLKRLPDLQGIYEFVNPVLRLYTRLRRFTY
jgi:hypothetical protein